MRSTAQPFGEKHLLTIVGHISEILATAGFVKDGFKRLPLEDNFVYEAPIMSERLITQLTPRLFAKTFATLGAFRAFNCTALRDHQEQYKMILVFRKQHEWAETVFDAKIFEENVTKLYEQEFHLNKIYRQLLKGVKREELPPRVQSTEPVAPKRSDLPQRAQSTEPTVTVKLPPVEKREIRRQSDPVLPLERGVGFENMGPIVKPVSFFQAQGKKRTRSHSHPFLRKSNDGRQPCHRPQMVGPKKPFLVPIMQAEPKKAVKGNKGDDWVTPFFTPR